MLTQKQKEKVWNAASKCLISIGYKKMSLSDVADTSGIALEKIKKDYKDKGELIVDVLSEGIAHVTHTLEKSISARGKADIKLSRFVKNLLTDYETHSPMLKLVSITFQTLNEEGLLIRKLVNQDQIDRYRRNTAIIARIIAEGQSEGIFRKSNPLESAYYLRGLINSAILYWRATKYEGKLAAFADHLTRIFFTGIYK